MKPAPATAPAWRADLLIRAIALAAGALSLAVLIGWMLQLPALVYSGTHGTPMRFNTAVCLATVAVALWASVGQRQSTWRPIASFGGLLTAVIGLLTLVERSFDWDLHIDQLLCSDTFSASRPGQMSGIAAAIFVLIGGCILARAQRRAMLTGASQWLALTAALAAQWAVLDVLLRTDEGTGIAGNTAFALLGVSFALLIMPSDSGFFAVMSQKTALGRTLRCLLPITIFAPLLLGCLRWYLVQRGWIDFQAGLAIMVAVLTASVLTAAVWAMNHIDRVERKRQQLEKELADFFRLPMHSLLSIIGFDGRFKRISSSWSQITGYDAEQILQTPYMEMVHPDDREITGLVAARIAAGEPALEFENRYVTKDGSVRWLMWNAIPASGDVMYAIAEDITQRKETARLLRESEERLRLLIEGLKQHAVYMLDPEGRIMTWNRCAAQLTGYSEQEVMGHPVAMLFPPEIGPDRVMRSLLQEAVTRGHAEYSGVKLRKDGTRFRVESHLGCVRDEEGRLVGFAKISREITERCAAEAKIRELNEQLEHKVEQRTAQLAASNKELEAFAYSVSHDLRAPLRHLDGFLSLLERRTRGQVDERAQHYIDNARGASHRMGILIDELLQFSRLGRNQLHPTSVALDDVVTKVRQELEPESCNRAVHWDIASLPTITADASMLRLLMQNLLGNALKFTGARAPAEISVGTRNELDGAVTVWVRDNGVGFDMQYYNKLFEVFQRLHSEAQFAGTGIGLANVRRIVERHGGKVWAESVLDKGATFYFSLPQERGDETGAQSDEPVEAYSAGGR